MVAMADGARYEMFAEIVGAQLGAVTFVQDYLQLHFDGPTINVTAVLRVSTRTGSCQSGEPQFRDALCAQIAKIVSKVSGRADEALRIRFEDESEIAISLRAADRPSGESYFAHGFASGAWHSS